MLRGFDSGYSRPTFGVFVEQCWNRRGLATLALSYALAWCRCNHIHAVMLKVASGNRGAVQVYERAGFVSTDICDPTGHKVYEWHAHQRKDLNRGVDADD
jgi:GNAT superfamily N-acetyltransferase